MKDENYKKDQLEYLESSVRSILSRLNDLEVSTRVEDIENEINKIEKDLENFT